MTLGRQIVQLRARCDGLEILAWYCGEKEGTPAAKTCEMIDRITEASHQCQLDQMESEDPAGAAALDDRKLPLELDAEFMKLFRDRYPLNPDSISGG